MFLGKCESSCRDVQILLVQSDCLRNQENSETVIRLLADEGELGRIFRIVKVRTPKNIQVTVTERGEIAEAEPVPD